MYYTYVLADDEKDRIKVGVTNNLYSRLEQIAYKYIQTNFSAEELTGNLVYFESFYHIHPASYRKLELLKLGEEGLTNLISSTNPHWDDLRESLKEEIIIKAPKYSDFEA